MPRTASTAAYSAALSPNAVPPPTADMVSVASWRCSSAQARHVEHGRWDPHRSMLRTYFINACTLNFPTAFGRWARQEAQRFTELRDRLWWDTHGAATPEAAPSPEKLVADHDELREAYELASPSMRLILWRLYQGWTHSQIGTKLGLTTKAVEGRLARYRRALAHVRHSGPHVRTLMEGRA